ncbi:hypothetical protein B0H11DRAFT_2000563 [Mycena galericulata]|nr:hypothetical protein B0H11DRAFT_2000563 [Mycena galericulata]
MSASKTPNGGISTTPRTTEAPLKSPDWAGMSLLTAKAITTVAGFTPFPFIGGILGTVVFLFETVETVKSPEHLKELCVNTVAIIEIVRGQISAHGDGTAAANLKRLCDDLERCLQDIIDAVEPLQKKPMGFHSRFKEGMKLRIETLRSNLSAAMEDTNRHVNKLTKWEFPLKSKL